MALYCDKCGAEVDPGTRVCMNCGSSVAAPIGRTETSSRSRTTVHKTRTAEPRKRGWFRSLFAKDVPTPTTPEHVELGEEITVVFGAGESGAGFCDADDQTTVLPIVPQVTLERLGTGELLSRPLPFVIGKGSAADVRIGGNPTVSRRHARVFSNGVDVLVEDLGSTNKTKVNGSEVAQDAQVGLGDGDRLLLSDEAFTVHIRRP